MLLFIQIIVILTSILLIGLTVKKMKYSLNLSHITLLAFEAIFVLPIILEWVFGPQNYSNKFPGYERAVTDSTTNLYYCLFVLIISLLLYIYGKKSEFGIHKRVYDIKDIVKKIRINYVLYTFMFLLMFLPVFLILISPSPEKYLSEYAYFQKFGTYSTDAEMWYHSNILRIGGFVSLLAIVATKFFSKNTPVNNLVIYIAALLTGIINGKRTLLAFIILGILIVDIFKSRKGKIPYKKIITSMAFIVIFFISYSFIIDKQVKNLDYIDTLRLYFFRDSDVKFSIYALLNPEEFQVLEYWGQSYLYNLFFYVPRTFWLNKPFPYDVYVTTSVLGYSPGTAVSWNLQTSLFGEALSNLGWFGIPFILILLYKFIKVSERSENPLIVFLCMFIIFYSFMNHFGSYLNYIFLWVILVIYNKVKNKYKIKFI